jgi:anti-sigma factor RsiW
MISCTQVRPILSLLLEKETGPLETLQARQHLDACDRCRSRARRLETVMLAASTPAPSCDAPHEADIASSVMRRLRDMKARMNDASVAAASKWTGLVMILGAALAGTAPPGAPFHGVVEAVARPFNFIFSLFTNGDGSERVRDLAGVAAPIALKLLDGSLRTDLSAGAGFDLVMLVQILATALAIGFTLIIPVAVLTAWFLHQDHTGHGLSHH